VNRSFAVDLALRYLRSARRDAFTSFLSAVAAGGIGLGVAALVVALAALAGMQGVLRDEIVSRTPALAVTLPAGVDTLDAERQIAALPEVESVQRVLEGRGWVVGSRTALPVRLLGHQGAPPRTLPGLPPDAPPGLYLPDGLATRLGLTAGEIVQLASARPSLTPLGPRPRLLSARLAGTYISGLVNDEAVVALPLERAEILLGRDRESRFFVATRTLEQAPAVAVRLAAALPAGSRVETWRELNRPLFLALTLERTVLFAAVSLIVAVAALALFSDLQLMAATKRRELALLTALGADEACLRRAFLWIGLLLGGGAAIAGGLLGGTTAWVLDRWRLVRLPPGLLVFEALPFDLRAGDLLAVVGITLLLTIVCAGFAASRAARIVPAEALRG
jgi:lipoprotein-releasing system permease protein